MKPRLAVRIAVIALACAELSACDLVAMETGRQTCSNWTADKNRGGNRRSAQQSWAFRAFQARYDEALKRSGPQSPAPGRQLDDARLLAILDAYCASHPEATNGQAAQAAVAQEMSAGQPAQPQPPPQ
jgi:hypothetical protein